MNFAAIVGESLGLGEAQSLARVELAEINRLRNIGIGLNPVLGNLKHQPSHVFQFAFAHHISDVK